MSVRKVIIVLLIMNICCSALFSFQKTKIYGIRCGFFLIFVTKNLSLPDAGKYVFTKTGDNIGIYMIMERSGDSILCKLTGNISLLNEDCYVKTEKNGISVIKEKPRKNHAAKSQGRKSVSIKGVEFRRITDNLFVTKSAIPISAIKNLTYRGLKKYIRDACSECERGYTIEMMNPEEIEKYINLRKGRILLGISQGRVVIVYKTNGKIRSSFISEATIRRFTENIFFTLILKNKRG